jgi:hypothetical protein
MGLFMNAPGIKYMDEGLACAPPRRNPPPALAQKLCPAGQR